MVWVTNYSYGQIEFTSDSRDSSLKIEEGTEITYTITPAETRQNKRDKRKTNR